jgi:hypothetical protein
MIAMYTPLGDFVTPAACCFALADVLPGDATVVSGTPRTTAAASAAASVSFFNICLSLPLRICPEAIMPAQKVPFASPGFRHALMRTTHFKNRRSIAGRRFSDTTNGQMV